MKATQTNSKDGVRMHRIKSASTILRAIMLAGLIVEGAAVTAGVFALLITMLHPPALRSHIVFLNCGISILSAIALMVTLNFFRLFTRLKNGDLFEGQTIDYLEVAGKWWIALGIAQVIYQAVKVCVFPADKVNIGADGIFCGLLVCFIAWVLREGQKLKEDQELTV